MRTAFSSPWLALVLLVWPPTAPAPAWAQTPAAHPPAGHTRTLAAQRIIEPPAIDGRLIDASWQLGSTAADFWVSAWRQAPTDQTRVVVLYDDKTLYVAFTCSTPGPIWCAPRSSPATPRPASTTG